MRIQYKTGGQRTVRDSIGRRLVRVGIARELKAEKSGMYMTRDMRASTDIEPMIESRPNGANPAARDRPPGHVPHVVEAAGDGLDDMDAGQLRALAKDRGVRVHHNAGAQKVRDALRAAS